MNGSAAQRQAEADGRIAGLQIEPLAPQGPAFRDPAAAPVFGLPNLHGQHIGARRIQSSVERSYEPSPLARIGKALVAWLQIERQFLLDQQKVSGVLIGGNGAIRR